MFVCDVFVSVCVWDCFSGEKFPQFFVGCAGRGLWNGGLFGGGVVLCSKDSRRSLKVEKLLYRSCSDDAIDTVKIRYDGSMRVGGVRQR